VRESSIELRKVAWPSSDVLARATVVVLVAVVLVTTLVLAFDLGASAGFDRSFGR
jgi:preprotein translocase SecE subunit